MKKHVRLVAWLYLGLSGLIWFLMVYVALGLGGLPEEPVPSYEWLMIVVVLSTPVAMVLSPVTIGAIGLLRNASWARIWMLAVAGIGLIIAAPLILPIPLGFYAIWVLTRSETKESFTVANARGEGYSHVTVLAWVYLGLAALCWPAIIFYPAVAFGVPGYVQTGIGSWLLILFTGIYLALATIGGVGLLKRTSWARALMFVVAGLTLLGFFYFITIPIGLYALWVLTKTETKKLFENGHNQRTTEQLPDLEMPTGSSMTTRHP